MARHDMPQLASQGSFVHAVRVCTSCTSVRECRIHLSKCVWDVKIHINTNILHRLICIYSSLYTYTRIYNICIYTYIYSIYIYILYSSMCTCTTMCVCVYVHVHILSLVLYQCFLCAYTDGCTSHFLMHLYHTAAESCKKRFCPNLMKELEMAHSLNLDPASSCRRDFRADSCACAPTA